LNLAFGITKSQTKYAPAGSPVFEIAIISWKFGLAVVQNWERSHRSAMGS
jgi:hypothetical protein